MGAETQDKFVLSGSFSCSECTRFSAVSSSGEFAFLVTDTDLSLDRVANLLGVS